LIAQAGAVVDSDRLGVTGTRYRVALVGEVDIQRVKASACRQNIVPLAIDDAERPRAKACFALLMH
jgi:hypothetical protein